MGDTADEHEPTTPSHLDPELDEPGDEPDQIDPFEQWLRWCEQQRDL